MRSMLVLAAVAALSFTTTATRAADSAKHEYTGTLIDNHCAEDMAGKEDAQKSADAHKKGCLMKCAKDGGGLSLMSDGKLMKLDKDSETKAMDFLKEKGHGTHVAVEASKNDDGTLSVATIEPAKKEDKKAEKTETK